MIHEGMSFAEYRQLPGLNSSLIKPYAISPRYGHWRSNQAYGQKECFKIGHLAHSGALEGDAKLKAYIENENIIEGYPINSKTNQPFAKSTVKFKNWYAEQDQTKDVMFPEELEIATNVIKSIRSHKPTMEVLSQCNKRELVITWTCDYTGEQCKAMIDACGKGIAMDLKTYGQALNLNKLQSEMYSRQYHLQFAFYADGLHKNGLDPDEFYVVFAQSIAPYDVGCFNVNYTALEQGRTDYIQAIANYHKAQNEGEFKTGSFPQIKDINIPYYAIEQDDDAFADQIEEAFK